MSLIPTLSNSTTSNLLIPNPKCSHSLPLKPSYSKTLKPNNSKPETLKLSHPQTLKPSDPQTQLIKFKNLKPNSYIWKIKKIYAKNISTVRESYQSVP